LHTPRLPIRNRHRVLRSRCSASPGKNVAPATLVSSYTDAKKTAPPFSGSAACDFFSNYRRHIRAGNAIHVMHCGSRTARVAP
jgi:hypothetical protein